MKNFCYDAEGDILTVTFCDSPGEKSTGIELHENVVLYFVPDQGKVLELIFISYRALVKIRNPLLLKSPAKLDAGLQRKIIDIIQKDPVVNFLHIEYSDSTRIPSLSVKKVFDPGIMKEAA